MHGVASISTVPTLGTPPTSDTNAIPGIVTTAAQISFPRWTLRSSRDRNNVESGRSARYTPERKGLREVKGPDDDRLAVQYRGAAGPIKVAEDSACVARLLVHIVRSNVDCRLHFGPRIGRLTYAKVALSPPTNMH